MKNYTKYICLFLMILGASAHAWSAEKVAATFDSNSFVSGSTYTDYEDTNWYLSMGGGNDKAGFNKNAHTAIGTGNAYGTMVNTSHHGFYVKSKTALSNICKITFTYNFCSTYTECESAKIYLGYSTDGSTWNAVSLTSGSQGMSIAPSNTQSGIPSNGYNETTWTFEFNKIASAYYAVIISRNGSVKSDQGFAFSHTTINFINGCCDQIVTPAKGTLSHCDIAFSADEVATCSETAADRQLTVTLTPDACYAAPTADAVARASGIACTKVSGPTDNGDGTYNYVFQYAQNVTGTTTFNASVSTKKTYTVSYNKGTYGTGTNTSATKTCGVNLTLPGVTFTRTGYTQAGWSTSAAGTSKTYNLSGSYTADAGTTLYPYWEANTISITLDKNGGDANGSANVKYDATSLSNISHATRAGYLIEGYYAEAGCTNKVLTNTGVLVNYTGYVVSGKWVRATTPTTLYAKWTQQRTLAVANIDNVVISATSPSVAEGANTLVTPGTTVTLSHGAATAPLTWAGWNVYKTGDPSTTVSVNGSNQFTMPDYDVTISAYLFGDWVAFCVPEAVLELTGSPIVTAASHTGAVRATGTLTLTGTGLTPTTGTVTITTGNADVTLSPSNEWSFAAGIAAAKTPKQTITVTADASGEINQTIYVHYKPSSNTDAVADVTVTATYSGADDAEATVKVRSVKENFVIAAKVGTSWYALPNGMETSAVHEGVLIDVDETNKIAYGPSSVAYKMWPVRTTNGSANRYQAAGELVRFAGTEKALWANNVASGTTTGIRNWSTITDIANGASGSAGDTNDDAYEWKLTTTDGETYTIQTNQTNNKRELVIYRPTSGENAGKLVWATNGTYETHELRLFPLEERASINIIPREWKTTGLVYSVPADNKITAVSYKIGTGSETATTYTRHSTGGYGLYEVVLPDLTSQYGQLLTLKMTIDGVATYATTRIPIIVNTNKSTKTDEPFASLDLESKNYDVVVLRGATLTTNAGNTEAFKFHNLYLYAGATLVNNQNGYLSLSYLELRGGIIGIDAKNSYTQDVPHLMLGKAIAACPNGANLDMIVNIAHSYALSVPFDVSLADVNFANYRSPSAERDLTGTLDSHFLIMEYDGDQRSTGASGWKHITSTSRVLHAGEGYVLQAKKPKGQPFGVIRFPLSKTTPVTAWANASGEIEKGAISIQSHAGGANTPDNDKGWNLIANPYMANLSYSGSDESYAAQFTVGNLVKNPDEEHWDGTYKWTNTSNAYVTIPNDWYSEFPQYRANSAQAKYESFKNFFIQAGSDGSVTYDRSMRTAMPRYLKAEEYAEEPIYVDINLTHDSKTTQAGITIDADATPGYKFGEDQNIFENREALNYLKMYTIAEGHYLVGNTLTPAEAEQLIPLEFYASDKNGEYVFSMSETSDMVQLEYVILYDAESGTSTDLLNDDYTIELDETGLIENRFSISIKVKEKENTTTGVDSINGEKKQPLKFIYQDKMYILQNGVIYDATGKKVREINK